MTLFVNVMDLIGLGLLVLVALVGGVLGLLRVRRQARCPHARWYETSACDAVCSACGKNLGFIGSVRKKP